MADGNKTDESPNSPYPRKRDDGHKTDEKVDAAYPRKPDMDSRFLSGCLTIAILSLLFYAMLAWPFFAFPAHLKSGLVQIGLFGGLPTLVLGGLLVRIKGLEAATALAGGSFAGAIFAYLRLDSLMLGKLADVRDLPPPNYPEAWAWLIPLAWCLVVAAAVLLLLPRRETQDEGTAKTSR